MILLINFLINVDVEVIYSGDRRMSSDSYYVVQDLQLVLNFPSVFKMEG